MKRVSYKLWVAGQILVATIWYEVTRSSTKWLVEWMRKVSAVRVHVMKALISTYSHPGHCMDVSDVPQGRPLCTRGDSRRHPLNRRPDGIHTRCGRLREDRNLWPCWKSNHDSAVVQSVSLVTTTTKRYRLLQSAKLNNQMNILALELGPETVFRTLPTFLAHCRPRRSSRGVY